MFKEGNPLPIAALQGALHLKPGIHLVVDDSGFNEIIKDDKKGKKKKQILVYEEHKII